jgi:hypothetical protein
LIVIVRLHPSEEEFEWNAQDADLEWYIKSGNLLWPPGAPEVTMSVIAV